jgi:ubiquinone biosynthesis protein
VLFRSTVRALLSGVLFSRDESVLFHGDPHAGNLMVTRDGRLAILDWSLAGRLTAADRTHFVQFLLGACALDATRMINAVAGLACDGADRGLIQHHVDAALAEVCWHRLPGPVWVVELLDTLSRLGVRFPPRLLLFRKAFLTLQGVLPDICPVCSLDATLLAEALREFVWEWPRRSWKSLDDRDYGTHLSSADLLDLALRAPAILTQMMFPFAGCLPLSNLAT